MTTPKTKERMFLESPKSMRDNFGMECFLGGLTTKMTLKKSLIGTDKKTSEIILTVGVVREGFPTTYINVSLTTDTQIEIASLKEIALSHQSQHMRPEYYTGLKQKANKASSATKSAKQQAFLEKTSDAYQETAADPDMKHDLG